MGYLIFGMDSGGGVAHLQFHGHDPDAVRPFQEGLGGLTSHLERIESQGTHGRGHEGSECLVGRAHDAEVLRNAESPGTGGLDGPEGGEIAGAVQGVAAGVNRLQSGFEPGLADDGILIDLPFRQSAVPI